MNVQENSVCKLEVVENDVLNPPSIEIKYVNKLYIQTDSIKIPREGENEIVEKALLYKSRDIPNYAELAIEHWFKDKFRIQGNGLNCDNEIITDRSIFVMWQKCSDTCFS